MLLEQKSNLSAADAQRILSKAQIKAKDGKAGINANSALNTLCTALHSCSSEVLSAAIPIFAAN